MDIIKYTIYAIILKICIWLYVSSLFLNVDVTHDINGLFDLIIFVCVIYRLLYVFEQPSWSGTCFGKSLMVNIAYILQARFNYPSFELLHCARTYSIGTAIGFCAFEKKTFFNTIFHILPYVGHVVFMSNIPRTGEWTLISFGYVVCFFEYLYLYLRTWTMPYDVLNKLGFIRGMLLILFLTGF
jgi:hypothetical protein